MTLLVPQRVLDAPRLGTIQYHPSLLPLHRGPSSINWARIQGDPKTGLTIFWPDERLDEGPVLLQKEVEIAQDDTVGSLYFGKLFLMGVEAVAEAVDLVRAGTAPRIEQDHGRATYESWCREQDAEVDWSRPADEVHRLICGTDPQPGAWTTFGGNKLKLYGSRLGTGAGGPGEVLDAVRRRHGGGRRRGERGVAAGKGPRLPDQDRRRRIRRPGRPPSRVTPGLTCWPCAATPPDW